MIVFSLVFFLCVGSNVAQKVPELYGYVPAAFKVELSPPARFTVLSPSLIRMEYSETSSFEDRATLAVLNRYVNPPPLYNVTDDGTTFSITTSEIQLKYTKGMPFTSSTLVVSSINPNSAFQSWDAGQTNSETSNLLGTIRSLDLLSTVDLNCTNNAGMIINGESLHCEWGLISRDGWAIVNDTDSWTLTSDGWWDSVSTDDLDLYLFAHGHDYKGALQDFITISGNIPIVPKPAVGIWWTRWSNLNDHDVRKIVEDYKVHSLPLDVFILDMDWHYKEAPWGGYTWDDRLFQYPAELMDYLHSEGLIVGANIHDDNGVLPEEKMYDQMAVAVGVNPSTQLPINFSVVDENYLINLEDIVLGDNEKIGVKFWWIDWQQGETQGGAQGGTQNPTIWLNRIRSTDSFRRGTGDRDMVLARWGGLGNHRYQVGFSGDVSSLSWESLAFQPYFSLTASNVGYGFWSHDLEGPRDDLELYVRWVQWVAYSAVFRSHDRGMAVGSCADQDPSTCSIIKPWDVPPREFDCNRRAMIEREKLVPYIYNAYRQAFESGVSIIRPVYYEYPELDGSYFASPDGSFAEYFFGDEMIVAPIVSPADSSTNLASHTVWLPPGVWFEKDAGTLYNVQNADGMNLTKDYDLSEVPVFIRGGAVIPQIPVEIGNTIGQAAQALYTTLAVSIYPGATQGSTTLYEDDGSTTQYASASEYMLTNLSYSRVTSSDKITIDFVIDPIVLSFDPGMTATRDVQIFIVNAAPAMDIRVIGSNGLYSSSTYHGESLTLQVDVMNIKAAQTFEIEIDIYKMEDSELSGARCQIQHALLAKSSLDADLTTPGGQVPPGQYLDLSAGYGETLMYTSQKNASSVPDLIRQLPKLFEGAKREVGALYPYQSRLLLNMYDMWRHDNVLCGSQDCVDSNSGYYQVRNEGWQPLSSDDGAVPLYLYFSASNTDNYATTDPNTPSGYVLGVSDGHVLNYQAPGTVPLRLYYNSVWKDHMTVATTDGDIYANSHGYTLLNSTLGYVYPPTSPPGPSLIVGNPSRLGYASGILDAC